MYERLAAIPGISCAKPMGAFYMFPYIGTLGVDSAGFAARLLENEGVVVVPGRAFGADECVRLSYACGTETIERGMEAFSRFVSSL
jgi:aspartate aminotransferase